MKKFRARRSNPDGSLTNVMRREEIAFATATRDALLALGAKEVSPAYENGAGCLVVSMGEYEIDTKAGLLRVTAGGRDICTRFVYPQGNGNGKWNFHKFMVGIEYDHPDPGRKLLALFLENLRPLLKDASVRAAQFSGEGSSIHASCAAFIVSHARWYGK